MNYLSDDEHDETIQEDEDDIINQEEELDEETRNIIYNKVRDFNEDEFIVSKTKEPKNNNKVKKQTITLDDLLANNKSKKWESTRANNKKTTKEVKRHFNPKLPPYRTMIKDRIKNEPSKIEMNDDNFPSL